MRRIAFLLAAVLLLGPAALADEDEQARAGISALLETIRVAAKAGDRQTIANRLDPDALYDVMEEHGYFADLSDPRRARLQRAMRTRLRDALARRDMIFPFDSFELRQLSKLSGPGRYTAYVRLRHQDGLITKLRMAFVQRGDMWQYFDFRDLDMGFSLSSMFGVAYVAIITGTHKDWLRVGRDMGRISSLLMEGRIDEAEVLLVPFLEVDLPRPVEALVQLFMGSIRIHQERAEEGLAFLVRAEALDDDMPVIAYLRALAFNDLGRHREALAAAEDYVKRLDRDGQADLEIARALIGLDRSPEAIPVLKRILVEVPGDSDAVAYLAIALPLERKDELEPHFKAVEDVENEFEYMAELVHGQDSARALRWLTDLFARGRPAHRDVGYYRGVLLYDEEEYEAAAVQFERAQAALAGTDLDDETRGPYYEMYLSSMHMAGRPAEAVRRCIDPAYAFRHLVPVLADVPDPDALGEVMEAGKDLEQVAPWMEYARAARAYIEGNYKEAIPLLRAVREALAPTPEVEAQEPHELLYDAEDRLVRSLVRTKQLDEAQKLAAWIHERDEDPRYSAIVHAQRGDVADVRAAIKQALDLGYDPDDLFDDEDMKAFLAKDAFADLRKRFVEDR